MGWHEPLLVHLLALLGPLFRPGLGHLLGEDRPFTNLSVMNWVPQHGWAYSGGEWSACIGDGGKRGVLVETSMADFNELFEALAGER